MQRWNWVSVTAQSVQLTHPHRLPRDRVRSTTRQCGQLAAGQALPGRIKERASYTQARWFHPKLFGDIWKCPIMAQPNPAHTSYLLEQLLTYARLVGPSSSPTPRLTQKPHWDTVVGSKSRELPPSTRSIKAETLTQHCCHPTGPQTVKQLRVHGCSSYWTLQKVVQAHLLQHNRLFQERAEPVLS